MFSTFPANMNLGVVYSKFLSELKSGSQFGVTWNFFHLALLFHSRYLADSCEQKTESRFWKLVLAQLSHVTGSNAETSFPLPKTLSWVFQKSLQIVFYRIEDARASERRWELLGVPNVIVAPSTRLGASIIRPSIWPPARVFVWRLEKKLQEVASFT